MYPISTYILHERKCLKMAHFHICDFNWFNNNIATLRNLPKGQRHNVNFPCNTTATSGSSNYIYFVYDGAILFKANLNGIIQQSSSYTDINNVLRNTRYTWNISDIEFPAQSFTIPSNIRFSRTGYVFVPLHNSDNANLVNVINNTQWV